MKNTNSRAYLRNKDVYECADVVLHYSSKDRLEPVEEALLSPYLSPEKTLLDLGIGAGRTTGPLQGRVARYLGLDYSAAMVEAAKKKFPRAELIVADASSLTAVHDGEFDVVFFSFNGIDYLHPYSKRSACLRECWRVLKPGGVLIFSTHHSRQFLFMPNFHGASFGKRIWRAVYALFRTLRMVPRLASATFWRGTGYRMDPVHGGLLTYCGTPAHIREELAKEGFVLEDVIGADSHGIQLPWGQAWYHYVARKAGALG